MAGGVGSRFWPMSTTECPKQFIDVLGVGRSLLQLTYDRFRDICLPENIWIVTNKKYLDICCEQLPNIPIENILLEPCRRNTAPCIAYVSWKIKSKDPKANIVISPSDAIVTDTAEFQRIICACLKFTGETDAIVTLGIKPNRVMDIFKPIYQFLPLEIKAYFVLIHSVKSQILQQQRNIFSKTITFGMQAYLYGM